MRVVAVPMLLAGLAGVFGEGTASAAGGGVERIAVPLGGPSRGPATATVNIVEWGDFQCPFCRSSLSTVEQITRNYPFQVRIFFRHYPLPFHAQAPLAAEAAVAAEAQGKFWEMHDKLFANQGALDRPSLERYAQELKLDMVRFRAALDSHAGKAHVDEDAQLAKKLGVTGTPTFFVNGRQILGAQPLKEFEKVIDDEITRASQLLARGTAPEQVYATLLAGALPSVPPAAKPAPEASGASTEVYRIPTGDAPRRGGPQPKVTLIEFGDLECPFCQRVQDTLDQLLKEFGNDLQLVFRHNPLAFHTNAMPAALAAEAAHEQGKFWEMHGRLLPNQANLRPEALERHARAVGLDMAAFKRSIDTKKGQARIQRDMDDAAKFGARGTPTFFINGRMFRGAQPIESFRKVIGEELKKADARLAAGTPRAQLYAAIIKDGLDGATAPASEPPANAPDPNTRFRVDVQGAPVKGAQDALVTIVEWADFQCPFCKRVDATLARVLKEYGGKVRLVWRDRPLPFHEQAMSAAIAARAAGEQGKFWDMHARLFAGQESLGRASYERHAQELGLDMTKFKAALEQEKVKNAVQDDIAAGNRIGARGTPTFYINGRYMAGAQSFETFKTQIDQELRQMEALVAAGTPRSRLYADLMKDATARHDVPGVVAPEDDLAVYWVAPGRSPSKGPKNAALVVVVFADFQCPFCKRLAPILKELESGYRNDLRLVWKNCPLSSHADADAAARAALAANAQGKFWEMHDKLFYYSPALDRASLERSARELGLDVNRFKEDLESQTYEDQVQADIREGQEVGVRGTPTVFINGRRINGIHPFETYKKIADDELARTRTAPAKHRKALKSRP